MPLQSYPSTDTLQECCCKYWTNLDDWMEETSAQSQVIFSKYDNAIV